MSRVHDLGIKVSEWVFYSETKYSPIKLFRERDGLCAVFSSCLSCRSSSLDPKPYIAQSHRLSTPTPIP